MKFGVREICDVVLKAKANQKVGNKMFYKGEPVIYFDTLKTSSMEGAATTVYAQGGRGNSRLMAWEGERTITFTMEDALISPAGFMILSGAGLIEGTDSAPLKVHVAEQSDAVYAPASSATDKNVYYIVTNKKVSTDTDAKIYVMTMKNGEIDSEPYIAEYAGATGVGSETAPAVDKDTDKNVEKAFAAGRLIKISKKTSGNDVIYTPDLTAFANPDNMVVMIDYYTEVASGGQQIDITPDKFGGNYYLEASTLFRNPDGVDMPAEFIIPNCKIQSNFTFTMASSGDPSTFTFTMDAFPDYTVFNKTKKVLAAIQIISEATDIDNSERSATAYTYVETGSGNGGNNDNQQPGGQS